MSNSARVACPNCGESVTLPAESPMTPCPRYEEVVHDRGARLRRGKCVIETESGSTAVTFQVRWADPGKRLMEVQVDPFFAPDPPCCTSTEVMEMIDDIVKHSRLGARFKRIHGHRQTGYDKQSKTRQGECTIDAPPIVYRATFRVQFGNQGKSFGVDVDSVDTVKAPLNR